MTETKATYTVHPAVRIAPPARVGDATPSSAINAPPDTGAQVTHYDQAAEALAVCAALLPERLTELAYIEAVRLEAALLDRIVAFERGRVAE